MLKALVLTLPLNRGRLLLFNLRHDFSPSSPLIQVFGFTNCLNLLSLLTPV